MHRRFFLRSLGALGCSAAAHPFLTSVTLAEATRTGGAPLGEHRLVVAILRGAMDGLDAVQPIEDPLFARLRPTLADADALPLSDGFALHPALSGLMPLWAAGELAFAHAVSTPYRDKRSHFDGQDLLEAGTGMDAPAALRREGWLNRMLQAVPGLTATTAFAVGREALPLLAGAAPSMSWSPEQTLPLSPQGQLLLEHIYHDDDLFREAGAEAMLLAGEPATAGTVSAGSRQLRDIDALVAFAAKRLRGATRIAAFSQGGWDTHRRQRSTIKAPFARLEHTVLQLKTALGREVWGKTLFLAMTEFGRTVRENGTGGTDHGTGGLLVMAGGALKGAQVLGRWPGLADLYAGRDLMPTSDVRAWAAWGMHALYGLDRGVLERSVFPGLDMGEDPRFLA